MRSEASVVFSPHPLGTFSVVKDPASGIRQEALADLVDELEDPEETRKEWYKALHRWATATTMHTIIENFDERTVACRLCESHYCCRGF